ncbi:MAG TPA: hypothetical protein VKW77_01080, partial [Acidimicrobiales bacterium]|nr:hypothetical protein [Acidimicrobiales bacterium]
GAVMAAVTHGTVRQFAALIPSAAARNALVAAYRTAFASTFDHLMAVATGVAAVGALGTLLLVRQRDFVPSPDAPDSAAMAAPALEVAEPEPAAASPADALAPTAPTAPMAPTSPGAARGRARHGSRG